MKVEVRKVIDDDHDVLGITIEFTGGRDDSAYLRASLIGGEPGTFSVTVGLDIRDLDELAGAVAMARSGL